MKLIISRHGQTEWNAKHLTQGRTDVPLNEMGLRQAQALKKRLEGIPLTAVYTSPLGRAYNTALPAAEANGLLPIKDERIIEREFGEWEGVYFPLLKEKYPEVWAMWETNPYKALPPGAEPMPEIRDRCQDFINDMAERYGENDTVLVVCHSIPARILCTLLLSVPLDKMYTINLENASYSEFMVQKGKVSCITLNDLCHLQGLLEGSMEIWKYYKGDSKEA